VVAEGAAGRSREQDAEHAEGMVVSPAFTGLEREREFAEPA
jgi:hypothetical protein